MKYVKLFEAFVNEGKLAYGDEYNEAGFNLMQKDLEEVLRKHSFDYSINNPKSKQVEYKIEGLDGGVSVTIYRDYGNYFGKFYLYIYSKKLKPTTQTINLKDKNELNDILGKVAKLFNVMSPKQAAMKKQIDDLRYELEDILYMYGDSDEEQRAARNTSKFKSLAKKVDSLEAKYNKTFESFVNERRASMVGREYEPDYKELMELLDMAKEYADANLYRGKDFILYWSDDYVMFDNPNGAAVGYDKRDVRKKGIFPGKSEAVRTFKKANYNPEETIKQVEKHFNGKVKAELAKWQGEVIGVNYKFN